MTEGMSHGGVGGKGSYSVLIFDSETLATMRNHAEKGYPHEICGLILGSRASENPSTDEGEGDSPARVIEVFPAANNNEERANDRYELDPNDYQNAENHAAAKGLEILGIYHSHPDHPSRPSETDRLRAVDVWQNAKSWSYVIVEVAAGDAVSQRSWILNEERFSEEAILERDAEPIAERI